MKKTSFTVIALKGVLLVCKDKSGTETIVHPKIGCHPQVGEQIFACQYRSLQTKIVGGRHTQWLVTDDTGKPFWKQEYVN